MLRRFASFSKLRTGSQYDRRIEKLMRLARQRERTWRCMVNSLTPVRVVIMNVVDLERFELGTLLGAGSDYQVHAAIDRDTGDQVVIKRPNPDYITRKLHHGIDRLSEQLIDVHGDVGNTVPLVAHLVGYTEVKQHDAYFSDSLKESYRVLVQERAKGLPLACDIRDKFKGVPVGLGQNLFALHPLIPHADNDPFSIHHQLLTVEEAFHRAGHLLLDMRPQNIYFDPVDSKITVIDIGTMPTEGGVTQGRASMGDQPKDLHDFYLEIFKYYATPDGPPSDVTGYKEPVGMRAVPNFDQQIVITIQSFSSLRDTRLKEASSTILQRIQKRDYSSLEEFRVEFGQYLGLLEERNSTLSDLDGLVDVWRQAMEMLSENYWRKFLFDPDPDLSCYRKA